MKISFIANIGRFATPISMVVFLAHEITESQEVYGWWSLAVLIGSVLTSIGVEAVGIMSGHALEGFWRNNDKPRAVVSGTLLLVYMVSAIFILRDNWTLIPIPVIASVVYVIVAMTESLEEKKSSDAELVADDKDFERKMKILEAKQKQEQALAKIEASKEKAIAKMSTRTNNPQKVSQKKSSSDNKLYECVCGRVFEGSRSYNAHRRHCEIPATKPANISANGHAN